MHGNRSHQRNEARASHCAAHPDHSRRRRGPRVPQAMTTLADFALGLGLEGECLMKTEDIMLALGLTTNLEPVPEPAMQMRERRRTGDPYARMRFEPEPDSYSDRSRSRKAARAPPRNRIRQTQWDADQSWK